MHFPTSSVFLYISNKGDTSIPLFEITLMGKGLVKSLDLIYNTNKNHLSEAHQDWGVIWTPHARWRIRHHLSGISQTHLNLWCVDSKYLVTHDISPQEKDALSLMMSVGTKELLVYIIPDDHASNFTTELAQKEIHKILDLYEGLNYEVIPPYMSFTKVLEKIDTYVTKCQQQAHTISSIGVHWPRKYVDALVPIPSGEYTGVDQQTWTVKHPFFMSQTLITQTLFNAVTKQALPSTTEANLPVTHCSWIEAIFFCNFLSEQMNLTPYYQINVLDQYIQGTDPSNFTAYAKDLRLALEQQKVRVEINDHAGLGFRLPTFHEWCYAAAACQSYPYSGSENVADVAWSAHNSGSKRHPVAQLKPNQWGLYDMSGNLWEWCQDGPLDQDYSILCASPHHAKYLLGGSWANHPWIFPLGEHLSELPMYQDDFTGFRVVRNHVQEDIESMTHTHNGES